MHGTAPRGSADDWLVSVAPDPDDCREEWQRGPLHVALLPAGRRWDVLIVSDPLGYPTLDVLGSCLDRLGPVLAGFGDGCLGFFVPPGTATRPLGSGARCVGHGTWIVVVFPRRTGGTARRLIAPDGEGTLTDPAVLKMAVHEAVARLILGRGSRPGGSRRGGR